MAKAMVDFGGAGGAGGTFEIVVSGGGDNGVVLGGEDGGVIVGEGAGGGGSMELDGIDVGDFMGVGASAADVWEGRAPPLLSADWVSSPSSSSASTVSSAQALVAMVDAVTSQPAALEVLVVLQPEEPPSMELQATQKSVTVDFEHEDVLDVSSDWDPSPVGSELSG